MFLDSHTSCKEVSAQLEVLVLLAGGPLSQEQGAGSKTALGKLVSGDLHKERKSTFRLNCLLPICNWPPLPPRLIPSVVHRQGWGLLGLTLLAPSSAVGLPTAEAESQTPSLCAKEPSYWVAVGLVASMPWGGSDVGGKQPINSCLQFVPYQSSLIYLWNKVSSVAPFKCYIQI